MFEVKLRAYWADSAAAGIVYFANIFRFLEQAEEELYRAAGSDRHALLQKNRVWMPRVETFSRFLRPIQIGTLLRVLLDPQLKREKTVRFEFQVLDDATGEKLAEGYITAVCVDVANFKATPIPEAIRAVLNRG